MDRRALSARTGLESLSISHAIEPATSVPAVFSGPLTKEQQRVMEALLTQLALDEAQWIRGQLASDRLIQMHLRNHMQRLEAVRKIKLLTALYGMEDEESQELLKKLTDDALAELVRHQKAISDQTAYQAALGLERPITLREQEKPQGFLGWFFGSK